jgi:FkbM family methyltransferase
MNMLKAPLKHISPTTVVSILSGPLRGKKWVVGASRHAYWLGLYEKEKSKHFAGNVERGDVVYDVGAHVGYYTMLAATRAGPSGHVWAFEPVPQNFAFLQQHLTLNQVTNATCLQTAVADRSGKRQFRMGGTRSTGRLSSKGDLAVSTTSLDELRERELAPLPQLIKIDVEGAELDVLQGASHLLKHSHPKLYVATHGELLHTACTEFLTGLNYQVTVLEWDPAEHAGELFAG